MKEVTEVVETLSTSAARKRFGVSNDWLLLSPLPRKKLGHRTILWEVRDIQDYLSKRQKAA